MYRHCIHCNGALGTNEAIEALPVGRRIAFDGARGRLWVVCARCARWNLVPFEARWEALEQCERAFRGTRLRRSTDNVGLARLRDGTELVRIGAPLRPEFAAWRYAAAFAGRYWRAQAARAAGVIAVVGGSIATGQFGFIGQATRLLGDNETRVPYATWDRWRHGTMVRDRDGTRHRVNRLDLLRTRLLPHETDDVCAMVDLSLPGDGWGARRTRPLVVTGDEAMALLRTALPLINRRTGAEETVRAALHLVDREPATQLLRRTAERGHVRRPLEHLLAKRRDPIPLAARLFSERTHPHDPLRDAAASNDADDHVLLTLSAADRLAVEMALHEDDERRWLDGELHELERHWREAEEIAAIADRLLLPTAITERATALRTRAPDAPGEGGTTP